MENTNLRKPNNRKFEFEIGAKVFFQAWKKTFDKKLVKEYEQHLNSCGYIGCEELDYEDFAWQLFLFAPKLVEENNN